MTTLLSILNAADRAAVIEQNFELLDALLFGGTNSNFRLKFKGGRYVPQLWDTVTELWYDVSIVTVENVRAIVLGDTGEA
jgi:hypothetical protein